MVGELRLRAGVSVVHEAHCHRARAVTTHEQLVLGSWWEICDAMWRAQRIHYNGCPNGRWSPFAVERVPRWSECRCL